ncbi:MAG TPA: 6-phosphogluconolactonase [Vicinamibacteria bacterium]
MRIQVLADDDAVARAGAAFTAAEARAAVAARGRFVLAVSGGRTPRKMLRALADEDVPWASVHVVQVDERIAPAGHPDRNFTHLQESLLAHCPIPAGQVHAMPVEADSLEAASAQYAATLRQIAGTPPVVDLVHLGLGPDGHTASLVPGDPVLGVTGAYVALTGVYQGRRRMTLTYPALDRARRIVWIVTGAEKAEATARLWNGDRSIPGGRIRRDDVLALVDRAAAARAESLPPGPTMSRRAGGRRVGIATDHGGFALKEDLVARLGAAGHDVVDFGAYALQPDDDYPDYVIPLARAVAAGTVERGVAVCGSGVGVVVCANKVPGAHAGLIADHFSAGQGVEDDHMNILCMGGRTLGPSVAWDIARTFLEAEYSQAPRHLRRLAKVATLELENARTSA